MNHDSDEARATYTRIRRRDKAEQLARDIANFNYDGEPIVCDNCGQTGQWTGQLFEGGDKLLLPENFDEPMRDELNPAVLLTDKWRSICPYCNGWGWKLYDMTSDDAVETLNYLIRRAREITGRAS